MEKRKRFCAPMGRHYITKASANAAMALNMAKEMTVVCNVSHSDWPPVPAPSGILELVQIINSTSLLLIQLCHNAALEMNESDA